MGGRLNLNNALVDCGVLSTCQIQDSLALVDLYNATNGPNWTNTWDLTQPMDTWYGVILNGDGCVICLDLDGDTADCASQQGPRLGNNLVGIIPNSIGDLSSLEYLNLSGNDIGGVIPESIGNLNSLVTLDLSFNDLVGNIPESMVTLTNLVRIFLSNNNLSGNIPHEIGNLINVTHLYLHNNNLSGNTG